MRSGGTVLGMEIKPSSLQELPIITFNDRLTVHVNGEDIRAIHFPNGGLSTVADLKPFVAMLKDSVARVEKGIREGKTAEQLKQEKVLAGYEKWSGSFVSTDKFIDTLYNDLSGKKVGELIKHN
jgi:hypothetical protein